MYNCFLKPIFDYTGTVWGRLLIRCSNGLQHLQNKSANIILRRARTEESFKMLGCVTPQNVILTQNVIRIAAKCNTNAKCNKIFNAKCNNLSTQIVITFLTHNVITQNAIISEITTCMLFQNRYCGSVISS